MSNIRLGTGRGFRYVYSQKLPSVVRAFGPGNNPRSRVCRGMFDPSLSRESHRRDGMGHLKSTELPESLVHPAGYDREPRRSGGRAWVWVLGGVAGVLAWLSFLVSPIGTFTAREAARRLRRSVVRRVATAADRVSSTLI